MDSPKNYPQSVYEFGNWLKAHPWIKRVKLPDVVWERYAAQVSLDSRVTPSDGAPLDPVITWRFRQAMITERAWPFREGLFPARMCRRTG